MDRLYESILNLCTVFRLVFDGEHFQESLASVKPEIPSVTLQAALVFYQLWPALLSKEEAVD